MRFQPYRRERALAFAAAVALLTAAAPAASARPVEDLLGPHLASEGTLAPVAKLAAASRTRDISSDPGFDWGAAAIGGGAAIALLLLGSLAALAFVGRGRGRVAPETERAGTPTKTRR